MDGEKVVLEQCSDARLWNCHGRVTVPSDGILASDREHQVGQPRLPSESEDRPHSCHAQGAACLPTQFQANNSLGKLYNVLTLTIVTYWEVLELSAHASQQDLTSWSTFSSKMATRKHPNFLLFASDHFCDLREYTCQTKSLLAQN